MAQESVEYMRAVTLTAFASDDEPKFTREHAKPTPTHNQVLVKVRASGVTQVDRNFIRVAYQPEVTSQPKCVHDFSTDVSFIPHTAQGQYGKLVSSLPSLVGTDFVGVVEAIGSEVQDIKVGYDVVGLCPLDSCGAWAEYVVADAHSIVVKPNLVSDEDAAAALSAGVRAYTALHYKMKACAGDSLLIIDGASVYGSVAIQLALALGLKVITTATNNNEFNYLQGLSAKIDRVIDLTSETLVQSVMLETNGTGVDYVLQADPIASVSLHIPHVTRRDIIKCLGVHGTWVTSTPMQLDPPESTQLLMKSCSISFLFDQSWLMAPSQQGRLLHVLVDLMNRIAKGEMKVKVTASYPLEKARQAFLEAEQGIGAVVLKP